MLHFFFALFVLLTSCSSVFAQNTCTVPNLTPVGIVNASEESNLIDFECHVSSNPSTYMWQVNGTDSTHNQFRWVLTSPLQGGTYRCGYTCNGTAHWSNNVTIITPPTSNIVVSNNNTVEGQAITLSCQTTGYPSPNVTWYFGNVTVGTGYILTIGSASLSDSGTYTCVARNSAGYSDSSVVITVIINNSATSTFHTSAPVTTTMTFTSSITIPATSSSIVVAASSSSINVVNTTTTTMEISVSPTSIITIPSTTEYVTATTSSLASTTPTVTPTTFEGDMIGFVVSMAFVGFGGLLALLFMWICVYWIIARCLAKRKKKTADDKEKLIDNEEKQTNSIVNQSAAIPLSSSHVNGGFKMEDDKSYSETEIVQKESVHKQKKRRTPPEVPLIVPVDVERTDQEQEVENIITVIDDAGDPDNDNNKVKSCLSPSELQQLVQELEMLHLRGQLNESTLAKEYESIPQNMQSMDLWPAETHSKNRYRNVIPNKETVVVLENDEESSYINANYLLGYKEDEPTYISTQGPIYETIPDFWQMVWQCEVETIAMLCKVVEGGKNKCAKYWPPPDDNDTQTYGKYVVRNNYEETLQNYKVIYLSIFPLSEGLSAERDVTLFMFTGWPDFGVPKETQPILEFREAVKLNQMNGPLVVHCSAGIGRSGTYIALDLCIEQYDNEGVVSPLYWTRKMREQRGGMIQTVEQYTFLHLALASHILKNSK